MSAQGEAVFTSEHTVEGTTLHHIWQSTRETTNGYVELRAVLKRVPNDGGLSYQASVDEILQELENFRKKLLKHKQRREREDARKRARERQ